MASAILELIDTLWNVNSVVYIEFSTNGFELIDTLWNVNNHSFYIVNNKNLN